MARFPADCTISEEYSPCASQTLLSASKNDVTLLITQNMLSKRTLRAPYVYYVLCGAVFVVVVSIMHRAILLCTATC